MWRQGQRRSALQGPTLQATDALQPGLPGTLSGKISSAGWRDIGGERVYFRSRWEANYARYLQFLLEQKAISAWQHEPETFWFLSIKRGVRSYLPDFKIIENDGSHHWVEVKGYMDPKSQTKLKRFAKYYPQEKLTVVSKDWFSRNAPKLRGFISDWE